MKTLRFIELLLLSEQERSARRVTFDPRATVIKGQNNAGKSSILKSLYETLGAAPAVRHPSWEAIRVMSSLRFVIDGDEYRMLKSGDRYTLFDKNDSVIQVFDGVKASMSSWFATMFNFHLLLVDKSGNERQAPPSCLFLPFYVDQDRGWAEPWQSFASANLVWLRDYKRNVAEFHAGVRPSEYYIAKAEQSVLKQELQPLIQKRELITKMREDVRRRLQESGGPVDTDEYRQEIENMLRQRNALLLKEEQVARELALAYGRIADIEREMDVARHTFNEVRQDRSFAAGLPDSVDCPVCGARYSNEFSDRFGIAIDESQCYTLLEELDAKRRILVKEREAYTDAKCRVSQEVVRLEQLAVAEREVVELSEYMRLQGQQELARSLGQELDEAVSSVVALEAKVRQATSEMRRLEDREHRRRVVGQYGEKFSQYAEALNVAKLPIKYTKKIVTSISETGSNSPRALLAYYYAVLHTIARWSTSTLCPIVIDSPHQQDQDRDNYKRMLEFIRAEQPNGVQMILAVYDDLGVSFDGAVVELGERESVLRSSEWEEVSQEIRPLREASLRWNQ